MSVTDPQATKAVAEAKLLFTYLYIHIFIYVPAGVSFSLKNYLQVL